MKMRIVLKLNGKIDAVGLWRMVQKYGVNVTELIDYTVVHGECSELVVLKIINCCLLFCKDIKIEMHDLR